ncbi:DUF4554 domain-containing protein isoform X1 [Esox lucius]|uniref:DUF4554 domain-containing protein isoform X1 n=1 Tax=Esox lucius TaxID=8010 RepID=UPI000973398E|nr:DUF4554 domain-containing protein isoform X1 [Esox lucius]
MLQNIQKVLRFLMLLARRGRERLKRPVVLNGGGLLVLLWSSPGTLPSGQVVNCTVAAAGPWCSGISMEEVQHEVWQRLAPSASPGPAPDPEELCAFTDLYGTLHFLVSLQIIETTLDRCMVRSNTEGFLHKLNLTNAGVKIHLTFKLDEEMYSRIFSGKAERLALKDQTVIMDVASSIMQPPLSVVTGLWCQRAHPLSGIGLPLLIPPEAMEMGLCGELTLVPVSVLAPCVLWYPNLATSVTRMQVLLYSPIILPLMGPSAFLQQLPNCLALEELGLSGLTFTPTHSTPSDPLCSDIVYSIEKAQCEGTELEWIPAVKQTLSLFLFFQHCDPFHSELSDFMDSEELLELHLEAVLMYNRDALIAALNSLLQITLKDQQQRHKAQEKMVSAQAVMLSSVSSVVSSSTNVEFRAACLDRMMVRDTYELSASLHESLQRATAGRTVSHSKCHCESVSEIQTDTQFSHQTFRE